MPRRLLIRPLPLALGIALACGIPTDRSGELRVELAGLPDLLLKDSVQLQAAVLDAAGTAIPAAALDFTSSDATVLAVSEDGLLRAVGVGTATLTVAAISFSEATPFTQVVRVRGTLEVDSVLPRNVRFGDTLAVFGVGLNPDSLFQISLGGAEATVAEFLPQDPTRPRGEAELRVWVPPPAERFSTLTLLGFAGGVLHPDTVLVAQRDLYEPNDTIPSPLGSVPFGFRNPALAFEPRQRAGTADGEFPTADWYTFDNVVTQDRTVIFFSENIGAQAFGLFLSDSLYWSPAQRTFLVGPNAWTIGLGTYLCGGLPFTRFGEPV
ncbi:MAG: hypothetical protein OER90_16660, partial [Gemmatimonadota bacterium]|nr:hypothetical protein [Gemmatimonadota bacterium]